MDAKQLSAQGDEVPASLPFRAVLVPHRSLSKQGFLLLMALFGGLSFVTGLAFALSGAWPVLGFFGVDVALVYLAFRLNYRAARATEVVEVTRDDLTITRTAAHGGRPLVTRLSSTWARLEEVEAADGSVVLCLASHGRRYVIARDLGSDERRSFARGLRGALRLVREPDRTHDYTNLRKD